MGDPGEQECKKYLCRQRIGPILRIPRMLSGGGGEMTILAPYAARDARGNNTL